MKINNEKLLFKTTDLALATTLFSINIPLESIERSSHTKKVNFVFSKENNNLERILQQYWRKEIRIEPQTYFQNLRLLKNRIYEKSCWAKNRPRILLISMKSNSVRQSQKPKRQDLALSLWSLWGCWYYTMQRNRLRINKNYN